jgi:hypothetical protein
VCSYEDRMKAVMFYIKYDICAADTVRELEYPGWKALARWQWKYEATGELHRRYRGEHRRAPRHTPEQMQAAVGYYLQDERLPKTATLCWRNSNR